MTSLQDETLSLQHPPGRAAATDGAHLLQLEVFEAEAHPEFAEYFFRRQHACYSRFRSEAATAPHQKRTTWKGVYLIVATDHTNGEIAGGVGVYERHPDAPLPVELAIGNTTQLQHALARWNNERVVELSGLWVEEHWRRTGLSSMLMVLAMSAAQCQGASKAVGFSHQHVLEFYSTIGLIPDHSVGEYPYPDHKYVSTFIWGDLISLETAPKVTRKVIKQYTHMLEGGSPITWTSVPRTRATPVPGHASTLLTP